MPDEPEVSRVDPAAVRNAVYAIVQRENPQTPEEWLRIAHRLALSAVSPVQCGLVTPTSAFHALAAHVEALWMTAKLKEQK